MHIIINNLQIVNSDEVCLIQFHFQITLNSNILIILRDWGWVSLRTEIMFFILLIRAYFHLNSCWIRHIFPLHLDLQDKREITNRKHQSIQQWQILLYNQHLTDNSLLVKDLNSTSIQSGSTKLKMDVSHFPHWN